MRDWIGYRWLIERFGLTVTQTLPVETAVGRTRATHNDGHTEWRTVQEALRPENTVAAHLAFALKHEGVHLETLSRLFAVLPAAELEEWIRAEPRGQYTGRAGFLYEGLSGRQLDVAFGLPSPTHPNGRVRRNQHTKIKRRASY